MKELVEGYKQACNQAQQPLEVRRKRPPLGWVRCWPHNHSIARRYHDYPVPLLEALTKLLDAHWEEQRAVAACKRRQALHASLPRLGTATPLPRHPFSACWPQPFPIALMPRGDIAILLRKDAWFANIAPCPFGAHCTRRTWLECCL